MKDKPLKARKPNPILYFLIVGFVKIISKFKFHVSVDKKGLKGVKGPFVVIGNHSSVMDIVYVSTALFPRRINVVAGRDLFTWKILKPFLGPMGVIPKSQFGLDIASIRMMCDSIKIGCNVAIYPEGKVSMDGTNLHYLPPSIGKFLKLMNAPVVVAHTMGAYLTKPRFQKGFNIGKVKVHLSKLFDKEELKTMKPDEIYHKVVEAIKFNDNIYQQRNSIRFRSKSPARSYEYILYKCPKCGAEYTTISTDRHLICKNCNNNVEMTEKGELLPIGDSKTFERIDLWYKWERESVKKELLEKGNEFIESHPVTLYIYEESANDYIEKGKGQLDFTYDAIEYKGTKDGEDVDIKVEIKEMHTITTKNEEGIDLVVKDQIWRMLFDENKYSIRCGLIVEELYRIKHSLK